MRVSLNRSNDLSITGKGVSQIIRHGGQSFVGLLDDSTVLKYPTILNLAILKIFRLRRSFSKSLEATLGLLSQEA
ncbi:hypothetical protein N7495_008673 [Penicillium taxi]|uniref:uncharacterized protein n=1 Tax=Penicillium taxi TaxID=168475 RepID=UPI0025458C97|nr:uncharacterized protein N7495_008673 [Penicillium taxi]KAJ5888632.1 hypothetical protein N7495_008673 [Penicillium taxi]